jgi:putative membrane protein
MTVDLFVRYLHFLGILLWIGALASEWALVDLSIRRKTVRQLAQIDRVYGFAALLVVGTGLLQWLVVGKPTAFYTGNILLYVKVGLATLVGLLSIVPSVFFARQRHGEDPEEWVKVPTRIPQLLRWQLLLMAIIPLLASLMAAGFGK